MTAQSRCLQTIMKSIANCNLNFIRKAVLNNQRVDTRSNAQCRDVDIAFGADFGTCCVRLGNTKVLAVTAADVCEPRVTRPAEGLLEFGLELWSSCEQWLDLRDRPLPPEGVHCLRLLERCVADSRAVDLESLCLVRGERVWRLRVQCTCLNFDGNLCEAVAIAAIASLAHFRRPQTSVSESGQLVVHSTAERHALPLTLLQMPFSVSFALFGQTVVCDPTLEEERASDGAVVVGANAHREIVALHCSAKSRVTEQQILQCSHVACERVKQITTEVKAALALDTNSRAAKLRVGFAAQTTGSSADKPALLSLPQEMDESEAAVEEEREVETTNVYLYGRGTTGVGEGGESRWKFAETIDCFSSDEDERALPKKVVKGEAKSEDSDEEIMVLESNEFSRK